MRSFQTVTSTIFGEFVGWNTMERHCMTKYASGVCSDLSISRTDVDSRGPEGCEHCVNTSEAPWLSVNLTYLELPLSVTYQRGECEHQTSWHCATMPQGDAFAVTVIESISIFFVNGQSSAQCSHCWEKLCTSFIDKHETMVVMQAQWLLKRLHDIACISQYM